MLQYSRTIRASMYDQELDGNEVSESEKGRSVPVLRAWERADQEAWLEDALWIQD